MLWCSYRTIVLWLFNCLNWLFCEFRYMGSWNVNFPATFSTRLTKNHVIDLCNEKRIITIIRLIFLTITVVNQFRIKSVISRICYSCLTIDKDMPYRDDVFFYVTSRWMSHSSSSIKSSLAKRFIYSYAWWVKSCFHNPCIWLILAVWYSLFADRQ
jgi:hypothetical protein